MNKFLNVANSETRTENGALTWTTTNSVFVDQFGKAGSYRGRSYEDVSREQAQLWDENPTMAFRFILYLRMVTRKIKINNGFITETVQKGQGNRDESFKRLLWVAENHQKEFYENLWLLPIVGSWKDLFQLMHYDIELGVNTLKRDYIYTLIMQGISLDEHVELIKKFMPRIKSKKKLTTSWTKNMNQFAIEFADFAKWSEKDYNKFKASGTAHTFQKHICGQMYDKIQWGMIPGRALSLITSGKFLEKHNLEDAYIAWLDSQPIAKFTGYVYELGQKCRTATKKYQLSTIDKQFNTLIEKAMADGKITENVWCALDTSGSMSYPVTKNVSAFDVCISLGIFFSTLNQGAFHKNVIMFDSTSHVKQLNGTFSEMMKQVPKNSMGSTNFQSVVDEICRIRLEHPEIPLTDYPTTLLVVSDMEFNPVFTSWKNGGFVTETHNFEASKNKLKEVFPSDFVDSMKFIWWDVASRQKHFPAQMNDGGCYMFSGFDGSIVSLLLNEKTEETKEVKQPTMEEMVEMALNQEILLQVKI